MPAPALRSQAQRHAQQLPQSTAMTCALRAHRQTAQQTHARALLTHCAHPRAQARTHARAG
eukprot:4119063-Alexandrium_andersonii.AAC.1